MYRELSKEKVIYNFKLYDVDFAYDNKDGLNKTIKFIPEYKEVYEKINMGLKINKEGYNIYLIDDFSTEKLKNITEFIKSTIENKRSIQDICYAVIKDIRKPKALFLNAGKGNELKSVLKKIQKEYVKFAYEFYNGSSDEQKEILLENLQKKKTQLINKVLEMSEKEGFALKVTEDGFNFIPLKQDGEMMNENEYELLSMGEKEDIGNKVNILKSSAEKILEELKNIELGEIEKIKLIIDSYYKKETKKLKEEYLELFKEDNGALEFLNQVCSNIEEELKQIYSINYENDKENISKIIYRYSVNVLVDNSENKEPPIVFEEDPTINNLLGSVEYENINGTYTTGVNLIRPGSFLKANGGCLILRVSSLLNNKGAYYYFKKSIISGKVDLNYDRGYLELLSLSGLKPEPVKFDEKIILIGDYNTYDLLYGYDEDFKKIFKIRVQYNALLNINKDTKIAFLGKIFSICRNNELHDVDEEGVKELAKFLSRKAEDRDKLFMNDYELERILMISDNMVSKEGRKVITGKDIINTAYGEELIEKRIIDMYSEGQIFINVKGKVVGQINGLSIINTGYFSFGKPVKITCTCLKGNGDIIDVQKESDLSGKIHNKAINILKGYIRGLTGGYDKVSADFYLSFEQIYGQIDGDSASVAEIISIISSLTKVGIKQNIAVTGSINQFGEIQPIGGVNEKIEGFFKVCKIVDKVQGKGVLIPNSNIRSLALKSEVENEIAKGNFHVYSMSNLRDAVEVLMERDYDTVIHIAKRELKKYSSNR